MCEMKCICHRSAGAADLHPSCPHHLSHHGSTGRQPSGPACALGGPSGHDPGPAWCPGAVLRHAAAAAPAPAAAAAVLPSTHEPCDAQDQHGGSTRSSDRRRHTGTDCRFISHPNNKNCFNVNIFLFLLKEVLII